VRRQLLTRPYVDINISKLTLEISLRVLKTIIIADKFQNRPNKMKLEFAVVDARGYCGTVLKIISETNFVSSDRGSCDWRGTWKKRVQITCSALIIHDVHRLYTFRQTIIFRKTVMRKIIIFLMHTPVVL